MQLMLDSSDLWALYKFDFILLFLMPMKVDVGGNDFSLLLFQWCQSVASIS